MFHVELRMGMQVVREFNLSERRLWTEVLAPLMAGQEFTVEGHEFIPRQTRVTVYEGPQLRPDQLGLGRGWQNAERSGSDVTERVLQRAREHVAAPPASSPAVAAGELLRERLIGRLGAGPLGAVEVARAVEQLLPDGDEDERRRLAEQAVWALLERDVAQLTPNGR